MDSNKGKQFPKERESQPMTAEDIRRAVAEDIEETRSRQRETNNVGNTFYLANRRKIEKLLALRTRVGYLTDLEMKYFNFLNASQSNDTSLSRDCNEVVGKVNQQLDGKFHFMSTFDN